MSEKRINKAIKQFMSKRPFKPVESFVEADVLLVFDRNDLRKFHVIMKSDHSEEFINSLTSNFKILYFKSTNPRDNRLTSIGFIKHSCN